MPDDIHSDFATTTVVSALQQTNNEERLELLTLLEADVAEQPATTELIRRSDRTMAFRTAAVFVVNQKRRLADTGQGATAAQSLASVRSELERLVPLRHEPACRQAASDISAPPRDRFGSLLPELADGRFIQLAFETVLSRGCHPRELRDWQIRLERGEATRQSMLAELFAACLQEADSARANESRHDPHVLHVMGTGERVTLADWQARAEQLKAEGSQPGARTELHARFPLTTPPRLAVTAIASLYRGGRYIRRFMENITRQTCFADCAELIIVDANSPDREYEVIEPYLAKHANIRYLRINHRIGIYDAWNRAIEDARGEYLTCTNVDDLRREDSLELQMTTLDALPFADVVYQDFYYTFDPDLTWEEVARFGVRARLPLVTRHTLLDYNPPHNAPMWRKRLHDELGPFDARYQSAGDYDFWMRCMSAGKTFFKLNDPHVVYYQNPEGLSTQPGTRGFAETREVHRRRDREVISDLLAMPFADFCRQHLPGVQPPSNNDRQDRSSQCLRALARCAGALKYARSIREAA